MARARTHRRQECSRSKEKGKKKKCSATGCAVDRGESQPLACVRKKKINKKASPATCVCVCGCVTIRRKKKKRKHKTTVYSCKEPALSDETHTSQSTTRKQRKKAREGSRSPREHQESAKEKRSKKKKVTRTRTKLRSLCRTHNSITGFFFFLCG